jgi:coproporphyrinogen III oxidase-like Fe-S oxidoreductase
MNNPWLLIPAQILTLYIRLTLKSQLKLFPLKDFAYPLPQPGKKYMLYLHIPFCESLCPYCSFNRFTYQETISRTYFVSLRRELEMIAQLGYKFDSMYIGGGTPTIQMDELIKTIDLAGALFNIKEVSCETNPNHLTPDIISQLQGRVHRLSVGVQSFDDNILRQISRYHKYGSSADILNRLEKVAGSFPTLNVDMIFNFPNQTAESLRKDIEFLKASGANQTTFYPLMVSPSAEKSMNAIGKIDSRREAAYYQLISDSLQPEFTPASAWTFSRTHGGMIDEYIVDYEQYIGVGSGSFSFIEGFLYVNTFSLNEYADLVQTNRFPVTSFRKFSPKQQMQYRMMMELFSLKMDKEHFKRDFNSSINRGLWQEMFFLRFWKTFIEESNKFLKVSDSRRYLLVVMMREFFNNVNFLRDQARLSLSPEERKLCLSTESPIITRDESHPAL